MNKIRYTQTEQIVDLYEFDSAAKGNIELEKGDKWALIKGFPNYVISSNARCWSKNRHILLTNQRHNNGYYYYCLSRDGRCKAFSIHRLVLMSFKPIKNMARFQVCHIDETRDNNCLENLEWGTARYNCNQRMHRKRQSRSHRGHTVSFRTRMRISKANRGRAIYECDMKGNIIRRWPYIAQAAHKLGCNQSNISKCCRGLRKSVGGRKWRYAECVTHGLTG